MKFSRKDLEIKLNYFNVLDMCCDTKQDKHLQKIFTVWNQDQNL